MTFNIRWEVPGRDGANGWPHRREMVFDILRKDALDVVGLQEATPDQLTDVLTAVPMLKAHSTDPIMNGIAILYRQDRFDLAAHGAFWFSSTPDVPESRDWGGSNRRHVCAWVRLTERQTERTFYVYNVHLDLLASSRKKSVILLCDRVRAQIPQAPAILLGDFNFPEHAPPARYMRGEIALDAGRDTRRVATRWIDSFRVVHPDTKDVSTTSWFRGVTRGNKIDHIFVAPGTQVIDASINRTHDDGRYPSDHYPVSATVILPD